MSAPVTVQSVPRTPAGIKRFLNVPYSIYANDPLWVAPLLDDLSLVFSDKNPLFHHAEMHLWVAVQNGKDVGRIAAILDHEHNKVQKDSAVFFGFFESINDLTASSALFAEVENWVCQKGYKRIIGPMNPTTNDECGLLIKGFDSSPVFMMTYNPPYYIDLISAAGFTKAKDLLAFHFDLQSAPHDRFNRFAEKFKKRSPEIQIRPVVKKHLTRELIKIKEVYNEAWEENWGFVPMTNDEMDFMAGRLKPLLTEGLIFVAENEKENEPIGFLLALPDFNQAIKPLRGHLLTPKIFGFIQYVLGWKVPTLIRVITLGVKKSYRNRGVEAAMLAAGLQTGLRLKAKSVEASWTLEDNVMVNRLIEMFGGEVYKIYRIYEKNVAR